MLFYGYYLDPLYMYLVLPAIVLCIFAQIKVKSTFSKYSKSYCFLSGCEAAKQVLEANGVYDVGIERVSGNLTDHYDPKANVIRLSHTVYDARTVSAVGVAAHEAGHAVQYAKNYSPIKWRTAIYPICRFGSSLSFPLLFIGLFLGLPFLMNVGIVFFALALAFQLITLPVEFNASRRAIETIRTNNLLPDEYQVKRAKKVLSAAALTYIAAFLVSLAQLLRLLALTNRRRR